MTAIKVRTTDTGVDSYDDAEYVINQANAILTVIDHKAHQTVTYGPSGWLRIEGPEAEMPTGEHADF
jgi:hypothetical protein